MPTNTQTAHVYEPDGGLTPLDPENGKITCVGRISDIYWDDRDNRNLRGFTLVDSGLDFGKGLSFLTYYHQPYESAPSDPIVYLDTYDVNKYVRVSFEVFDTYEEAANG